MAKSDVIRLVNILTNNQADSAAVDRTLTTVLHELARRPVRTQAEIVQLAAGDATFTLPSETMMLFGAIYDFAQLDIIPRRRVEQIAGPNWRDEVGTPRAVVLDDESTRTFRLWPKPDRDTLVHVGPTFFWELIGAEHQEGSLLLFVYEFRDLPPTLLNWMNLYLALRVIQRLFTQDSDTQDIQLSGICGQLAESMEPGLEILKENLA